MFVTVNIETQQEDRDFHFILSGERNAQTIENFSAHQPVVKIAEVNWGFGRNESCSIYSCSTGIIVHYWGDDEAGLLEMTAEDFLLELTKIQLPQQNQKTDVADQ